MPESYSVNQLKTWCKCRKKYELDYVRKLQWPANPKNFRLGKGVHQLLDYTARNLPVEPIVKDADSDIVEVWQFLQRSHWARLPVLASEWGFSLEVDGNWIYGRIDRIVQDGETIRILDWKTGTSAPREPETDWQTLIYLYVAYEARRDLGVDVTPEQLQFTYVQVKNGALSTVDVPYSVAMHEATRQRLAETLQAIQMATVYTLPVQCPDRFCPYYNICGIAKREDFNLVAVGTDQLTDDPMDWRGD